MKKCATEQQKGESERDLTPNLWGLRGPENQ